MENKQLFTMLEQYAQAGKDARSLLSDYNTLAATRKTSLGLNQWDKNDKPTMEDFNEDNRILDEEIVGLGVEVGKKADHDYVEVELAKKAEKVAVETLLADKVNKDGNTIMTGPLRTPHLYVHHTKDDINPWAFVTFYNDSKRATELISSKKGFALFRVYNPSTGIEYKELQINWDGDMYWDNRKVLTE